MTNPGRLTARLLIGTLTAAAVLQLGAARPALGGDDEQERTSYGHRIHSGGQSLSGVGAGVGSDVGASSGSSRGAKPKEAGVDPGYLYADLMSKDPGCNSTPNYCDSPVFVRSWEMFNGLFVGVGYGAGFDCCTYFCGHVRYWWFGKDATHGEVFDDKVEDPEDPAFSDGAVGKFCAYALPNKKNPTACTCRLSIIRTGDGCYTAIPKSMCAQPIKVSVKDWKDLYVCKGRPKYCLKH